MAPGAPAAGGAAGGTAKFCPLRDPLRRGREVLRGVRRETLGDRLLNCRNWPPVATIE